MKLSLQEFRVSQDKMFKLKALLGDVGGKKKKVKTVGMLGLDLSEHRCCGSSGTRSTEPQCTYRFSAVVFAICVFV